MYQADQARTEFVLTEEHLEFLAGQIARVPNHCMRERVNKELGLQWSATRYIAL
jgi:hypothetical protein